MSSGELVAWVRCRACGHDACLRPEALGGRTGPDLYRRLRCTACRALGRAEMRLIWRSEANALAGAAMGAP